MSLKDSTRIRAEGFIGSFKDFTAMFSGGICFVVSTLIFLLLYRQVWVMTSGIMGVSFEEAGRLLGEKYLFTLQAFCFFLPLLAFILSSLIEERFERRCLKREGLDPSDVMTGDFFLSEASQRKIWLMFPSSYFLISFTAFTASVSLLSWLGGLGMWFQASSWLRLGLSYCLLTPAIFCAVVFILGKLVGLFCKASRVHSLKTS